MTRKRTLPASYPAGHFTALIRQYDWPPRFESQFHYSSMEADRKRGAAAAREAAQQRGVGWGVGTMVLPNTPGYLPPQMMGRPA